MFHVAGVFCLCEMVKITTSFHLKANYDHGMEQGLVPDIKLINHKTLCSVKTTRLDTCILIQGHSNEMI